MKFYLKIQNRQDFPYPENFITTISLIPPIDIEPWWFIVFEDGDVNYWHQTLKQL